MPRRRTTLRRRRCKKWGGVVGGGKGKRKGETDDATKKNTAEKEKKTTEKKKKTTGWKMPTAIALIVLDKGIYEYLIPFLAKKIDRASRNASLPGMDTRPSMQEEIQQRQQLHLYKSIWLSTFSPILRKEGFEKLLLALHYDPEDARKLGTAAGLYGLIIGLYQVIGQTGEESFKLNSFNSEKQEKILRYNNELSDYSTQPAEYNANPGLYRYRDEPTPPKKHKFNKPTPSISLVSVCTKIMNAIKSLASKPTHGGVHDRLG